LSLSFSSLLGSDTFSRGTIPSGDLGKETFFSLLCFGQTLLFHALRAGESCPFGSNTNGVDGTTQDCACRGSKTNVVERLFGCLRSKGRSKFALRNLRGNLRNTFGKTLASSTRSYRTGSLLQPSPGQTTSPSGDH
jgi:hypothetical protein